MDIWLKVNMIAPPKFKLLDYYVTVKHVSHHRVLFGLYISEPVNWWSVYFHCFISSVYFSSVLMSSNKILLIKSTSVFAGFLYLHVRSFQNFFYRLLVCDTMSGMRQADDLFVCFGARPNKGLSSRSSTRPEVG